MKRHCAEAVVVNETIEGGEQFSGREAATDHQRSTLSEKGQAERLDEPKRRPAPSEGI
jgi:hypothetical protein